MSKMTAPGGWQVEQIVVDKGEGPVTVLRVKQHGTVSHGAWPGGGYCTSPAQVAQIMGAEAFAALAVA